MKKFILLSLLTFLFYSCEKDMTGQVYAEITKSEKWLDYIEISEVTIYNLTDIECFIKEITLNYELDDRTMTVTDPIYFYLKAGEKKPCKTFWKIDKRAKKIKVVL